MGKGVVEGIDGAKRNRVADHKDVVGVVGEAVFVGIGRVACLLSIAACTLLRSPFPRAVFAGLLDELCALLAQRGRVRDEGDAAHRYEYDHACYGGGNKMALRDGGYRSLAVANLAYGCPEHAMAEGRLDESVG